jgi:hypothetical protein
MRTEDGWYENTSEWAAVAVVFHRIFDKMPAAARSGDSLYRLGKETLKNWQPEEYETWFQTFLDADAISSLAIMQFHRLYADRWIVLDAIADRRELPRESSLDVRAKKGGNPPYGAEIGVRESASRWFRVSAAELAQKRGRPFLIDPAKHFEIDSPTAPRHI